MARYLVTGGAGFIGSHLVDRLLARGDEVVVLDNFNDFYDPSLKRRNCAPHLENRAYRLVEGDLRDARDCHRAFEGGIDQVIHLAAMAGVRPSLKNPGLYVDVNLKGTANLYDAALEAGCKNIVFASSSSVYGANEKVPFSEEDPVDFPVSPYAATKKAGELLSHTYHHIHGMDVACLRFFTVYGPRQRPEMAIHLFSRLILEGKPLPVFGDGHSRRDYTYIDDIVDGVVRAMERSSGYRIYNLGESQTIELRELVSVLEEALGKKAVIDWQPDQPGDVPRTWADVTRAREELGYAPSVDIREGVRRFVAWLRGDDG
ncbi:MAG TPA: NAD-dependent epimerase/dehydratase family protein [Planctomycetes bacterium]|nr:NAD-dependent epimerase/dehydratase family protein [Planctomycetota bacterium]